MRGRCRSTASPSTSSVGACPSGRCGCPSSSAGAPTARGRIFSPVADCAAPAVARAPAAASAATGPATPAVAALRPPGTVGCVPACIDKGASASFAASPASAGNRAAIPAATCVSSPRSASTLPLEASAASLAATLCSATSFFPLLPVLAACVACALAAACSAGASPSALCWRADSSLREASRRFANCWSSTRENASPPSPVALVSSRERLVALCGPLLATTCGSAVLAISDMAMIPG